jgi:glycosyltransferase involved in cell wall biosynthesis
MVMFAYACEPQRGSEPGAGFAFVAALASLCKKTGQTAIVYTRPHRVHQIEDALIERKVGGYVQLHAVSLPLWFVGITLKRRRITYMVWQLKAVLDARRRWQSSKRLPVFHHVTFATEAIPTFEWLLPKGMRQVFGPAGSSQEINRSSRSRMSSLKATVRSLIGRINLRRVDLAVAQNTYVAAEWESQGTKVIVEPNIVLHEADLARARDLRTSNPTPTIVSVGLLIERKRHDLVIEAMSCLTDSTVRLIIVGDGPLHAHLQQQIDSLGLHDRVELVGKKSKVETLGLIAGADALVLASRQEGAGWVVGEAQALGTTPVAFAGSGSDDVIRIGGAGIIAEDSSPAGLALCIEQAITTPTNESNRWSENRLAVALSAWYGSVKN